jgi:uncharacterized protein with HEPN domain
MPEPERLRLQLILDRVDLIRSWTANISEDEFLGDMMRRDAVALSLLVIGETAARLADSTKVKSPEVPWAAIVSVRNRLAHGYETVDHRLVWQIVVQDLDGLRTAVERLVVDGD